MRENLHVLVRVYVCLRPYVRVPYVPVCVSKCVGAHASALEGARSHTCGRACVRFCMYYSCMIYHI